MLQNRVDPLGNIIKTSARGAWTGTRGVLHDEHQHIIRPFKLKAWLTCLLQFKGRQRKVMSPNRYTELFFYDEATAFAAGHRPCAECRRPDFNRFKLFWLKGNPEYAFDEKVLIGEIDNILHRERIEKGQKITYRESVENIPDGCFVLFEDNPFLIFDKLMYRWSPFGYDEGIAHPEIRTVEVLTPGSVVNTFKAGYIPQMIINGNG